jgi:hypothetical protein
VRYRETSGAQIGNGILAMEEVMQLFWFFHPVLGRDSQSIGKSWDIIGTADH